jgi:pimeloyl-ACP methyl ester carboxylesterase
VRKLLRIRRFWLLILFLSVIAGGIFFTTSGHSAIWPLRNVLFYRLETWWYAQVGRPEAAGVGGLRGCVYSNTGAAVSAATVLVAERNGTTHSATTGATGCYELGGIPAGRYVPMVGATHLSNTPLRRAGLPISIAAGELRELDVMLPPVTLRPIEPGTNLRLTEPVTRTEELPQPGTALRREVRFESAGEPNQLTLLYTPVRAAGQPITATERLPTLLAIYPGPADTWEGVSIPLAAAGYAVLAVGPAYSLDLESDIDELQRLVDFVRAGKLPPADGRRIVVLGGSYSGLHAQRLLVRDTGFEGGVLLGPPTDLFDLRRRFEAGSFFPPYGLDEALVALGTPDTAPERYWRYSSRYHVRPDLPPMLLMHSRDDEIVPFQQSQILAEELDRLGVEYDAYFFDGLPHYLLADDYSAKLDELYTLTLDFLERTTRTPAD